MHMQVNPAKGNGTGKQEKEQCQQPPGPRFHFTIPDYVDQQSEKSKGRKRMPAWKAESVHRVHYRIWRSLPVKEFFQAEQNNGTGNDYGCHVKGKLAVVPEKKKIADQ